MTVDATETPQEPSQALTGPSEAPTLSLAGIMTPAALEALAKAGLSPELFTAPKPPEVTMTAFEALAVHPSKYPKAEGQTLPLVYLDHRIDAESQEPAGYQGALYISVVEPQLGAVVIKTSYARDTGELMPVSEWVTANLRKGDVFLVASIKTRQGFTVYRAIDPIGYPA